MPMVFDEFDYWSKSKNTHKPRDCEKGKYIATKEF